MSSAFFSLLLLPARSLCNPFKGKIAGGWSFLAALMAGVFLCGLTGAMAADQPAAHVEGAPQAAATTPRIAALYNVKKRHGKEFDYALATLGWSADRYYANAEDLAALPAKLSDYDIVIIAPLFNYKEDAPMPGKDRGAYMKFIENGGMLVVTDGSYTGIRKWLADIDPRFGGLEEGKCNSSQWSINGYTTDATPPQALRFFPFHILEPNSWPHYLEPPKDTKWQLVAKCSEGFPVTFEQTIGKGLVSISALRQASPKQFANFYATLQLTRAGIELRSFDLPKPAFGNGIMHLTFAGAPHEGTSFVYEIDPATGSPERFEGKVAGDSLELPYRITARGPIKARLLIKQNGKETQLFARDATMPQLLTVTPPAYRGILSEARRLPSVRFGIQVAPDQEKLEGATIRLTVLDPKGAELTATDLKLDDQQGKLAWRQPIELDQKLPAGDYSVKATLNNSAGKKLADAQTTFKILAPQPAQTIIDEDGTFLVDGKPFFPLGFYHVNPDDFKDVAALGINTVQFWTWHTRKDAYGVSRGLAAASANGLKAVFELNHKNADIVRNAVRDYGANPAILMWYGMDEPTEADYGMATVLRDTYHEEDLQHPMYAVSVIPDLFAEQSQFTDVFATDPYGKPSKAADWVPKAVNALDGMKPLIVVPGSFGKEETPAEMRATAYIALAHGVRGIIWYPWSQAGGGTVGIGAKTSPEQQATIAGICAEVKLLLPELTATVRQSFASEDGKLQCLYMRGKRRTVLMVNTTPEKLETDVALPAVTPGLEKTNAKMKDYFKKSEDVIEMKKGQFHVELEPYETRVYTF